MSYIGKLQIDSGAQLPIGSTLYGVCNSVAGAYEKVVTLSNFDTLINGVTVHVKFVNGNTAPLTNPSDATEHLSLTIGSTSSIPVSNPGGTINWSAGAIISFTFDETDVNNKKWIVNDGVITTFDASAFASSTHNHGNISNDGKLDTASVAVVTNANKEITTENLSVSDPSVSNNATSTSFISNISQSATGKISATKKNLPAASTSVAGIIQIGSGASDALAGNSTITIAGQVVALAGGSITDVALRSALGLSSALRFVGVTSTTMSDGYTGTPAGIDNSYVPAVGDVVIDNSSDSEYVCINVTGTTYTWERLGRDSSWALASDVIEKTGAKGDILYWSDTNTPTHLTNTSSATKQFLTITSQVPAWAVLTAADVGLDNLTNFAQVEKRIGTTKGDIIYWNAASDPVRLGIGSENQVLTVNASGVPEWKANQATDENVKQTLDASSTSTFPLLFSTSDTTVNTAAPVGGAKRNNSVYIKPSDGTLTAPYFSGNGSLLTNISWASINNIPTAGTNTLGLVKTTSDVSNSSGYTAAPIINGVVYYKDTNSHYSANLYVTGSASGTALPSSALTNGNVYLRLIENSGDKGTFKISGTTGIKVTAAATTGYISIDTNLKDISFTNAPSAATEQDSIGFVHGGVLYIKKFATVS